MKTIYNKEHHYIKHNISKFDKIFNKIKKLRLSTVCYCLYGIFLVSFAIGLIAKAFGCQSVMNVFYILAICVGVPGLISAVIFLVCKDDVLLFSDENKIFDIEEYGKHVKKTVDCVSSMSIPDGGFANIEDVRKESKDIFKNPKPNENIKTMSDCVEESKKQTW